MSHPQEPWGYEPAEWEDVIAADEDCEGSEGYPVSGAELTDASGKSVFTLDLGEYSGLSSETARRIVACVNACAGSSVEWLEFSVSEDCADLSGPFEPLETRITSILKTGLQYMTERDAAWSELREIRSAISANVEEATIDEVRRVVAQRDELQEQVECSNITEKNMEGRLNIATVKLAAMTEQRDKLDALSKEHFDRLQEWQSACLSAEKQRDELLAIMESILAETGLGLSCSLTNIRIAAKAAIASVKGGAA